LQHAQAQLVGTGAGRRHQLNRVVDVTHWLDRNERTREDAQKLVAWTHCAPRGTRSFGPIRALLYSGADHQKHANDTIVTFAMIEPAQALDNLDEILMAAGAKAVMAKIRATPARKASGSY
jgi:2-keto-3-deoxy-L-rhamnonate aldolase RhmA